MHSRQRSMRANAPIVLENGSSFAAAPISDGSSSSYNPALLDIYLVDESTVFTSIQIAFRLRYLTIGQIDESEQLRCLPELVLPHLEELTFYALDDRRVFGTVVAACLKTLRYLSTRINLTSVIDTLESSGENTIGYLFVTRSLPSTTLAPSELTRLVAACPQLRRLGFVDPPRRADLMTVLNALHRPLTSFGYGHYIPLDEYGSLLGRIINHPMLRRLRMVAVHCGHYHSGSETIWNSEAIAIARAACSQRRIVITDLIQWLRAKRANSHAVY